MSDSKKQTIIIAVLIVLIAFAGIFSKKFNDSTVGLNTLSKEAGNKKESQNFFIEGRLGKENARSILQQELENIIKDEMQTEEARNSATESLMVLMDRGSKENEVETLVKQRGFEDVLCFIDENGVELTVKTTVALDADMVNKIKDIVVRKTSISPSNIVIRESNN